MEREKPEIEKPKKKIVEKKRGKEIEQAFPEEFEKLNEHGISFEISIKEIQARVSSYSAGNGHSIFRDGKKGGKKIAYLCDKYQVEKIHENTSPNSELVSLVFSKKE